MSFALVMIRGIAGDDAHDRESFATVSVATHRRSGGEDVTDWHDIVAFTGRGDGPDRKAALMRVKKGDIVTAVGTLEYRKRDDGQKIARIVASVRLEVEKRGGADGEKAHSAATDDDIPF